MSTHMHFVLLHINTQKHICIHSYIHKITVNWRNISFVLYSGRPTSSSIFEVPVYSRYSAAEVGWLVHKESWEEHSKRRKEYEQMQGNRKHVGCLRSSKELGLTGEDSTSIEEDVIVKTGKTVMDRNLNIGQGVEYPSLKAIQSC